MFNLISPIGERAKGHLLYADIFNGQYEDYNPEIRKNDVDNVSESIFDKVFSVNPLTKLPDGDIALFMNDNTSLEVRDFISRNLMQENLSSSDSSLVDKGSLSDDDIVRYSRNTGESVEDYRYRIYTDLRRELESKSDESNK